nr:hypothetical protein [Pedobacter panaciterrae]
MMKKLMTLMAVAIFIAISAHAQSTEATLKSEIKTLKKDGASGKAEKKKDRKELRKLEGTEASYQAKQKFATDFGDLPVTKWVRSDNFDEATFNKDGKVYVAYYDPDADLVGTITSADFKNLPEVAQKFIHKHYSGYTVGEVKFFDDNEYNDSDILMYGDQFDGPDSYFVELKKGGKIILVRSDVQGNVSFFKAL